MPHYAMVAPRPFRQLRPHVRKKLLRSTLIETRRSRIWGAEMASPWSIRRGTLSHASQRKRRREIEDAAGSYAESLCRDDKSSDVSNFDQAAAFMGLSLLIFRL
jgi:hypothetical protein